MSAESQNGSTILENDSRRTLSFHALVQRLNEGLKDPVILTAIGVGILGAIYGFTSVALPEVTTQTRVFGGLIGGLMGVGIGATLAYGLRETFRSSP